MNARLKEYLSSNGVIFKALTHPPTTTSIESANYRGVPVSQGAKVLTRIKSFFFHESEDLRQINYRHCWLI